MPPCKPSLIVRHANGDYPIFIGAGLIDRCGDLLTGIVDSASRDVVITDKNVLPYYKVLAASLGNAFPDKHESLLHCLNEPGEECKSLDNLNAIWSVMQRANIDRAGTVIALGGGVVGDLAGFVAATWMRGVPFVQVPTTLLAQVDSSVGGKTGINLRDAKNMVGAFWQPQAVIIDPTVLKTLDEGEFTSGLAEVVKYGVIMDKEFFDYLGTNATAIVNRDMETLEKVILRCCQLKAQVVEEDERETSGRRAILNYGHTFGHAIESVFGYGTWRHGHAVAMGMHAAAHLARILGRIDNALVERQRALLDALNIPCAFPGERHEEMLEVMRGDKKSVVGDIRFVLPARLGKVELVGSVDREKVLESMKLACG